MFGFLNSNFSPLWTLMCTPIESTTAQGCPTVKSAGALRFFGLLFEPFMHIFCKATTLHTLLKGITNNASFVTFKTATAA